MSEIVKYNVSMSGVAGVSPVGILANMTVNSLPTVAVETTHPHGGSKIFQPGAEGATSMLAQLQGRRLAGRTKPDVEISLVEENGGSFNFSGFMSAPVLEVTKRSAGMEFTAMGMDGLLDGLDLSIYRTGFSPDREESAIGQYVFPDIPPASSDVAASLSAITTHLVGSYEAALQAEKSPSMQRLMAAQHALNTSGPLDTWLKILGRSDVVYSAIGDLINENARYILAERFANMLTQKHNGFWSTAHAIMAGLSMAYVPDGIQNGRFIRADRRVLEAPSPLDLTVLGLTISDGSHKLMPVGGVAMVKSAGHSVRSETENDPTWLAVAAQYPPEFKVGFIHREPAPLWLVGEDGLPFLGVDGESDNSPPSYNLSSYVSRRKKARKEQEGVDAGRAGAMEDVCKSTFLDIQLAHSVAVIRCPITPGVPLGKRVVVKLGKGGQVTGFVDKVVHNLRLAEGRQMDSYTNVHLTHTTYV